MGPSGLGKEHSYRNKEAKVRAKNRVAECGVCREGNVETGMGVDARR